MGWLYMQSLNGHKSPTEYLDHQFNFVGEKASYRVLKSALVRMKRYYAAVEKIDGQTGETKVFAIVCLVNYNPRDKDGYIFGYKDMDETMGPGEYDCPASILDLLTPTDSDYANEWRAQCRQRLEKKLPKDGDMLVLANPLKFTDGSTQQRFRVVEHKNGTRKKLMFLSDNGSYYRLRNLKDLDFTVAASPQVVVHPPAPTLAPMTLF